MNRTDLTGVNIGMIREEVLKMLTREVTQARKEFLNDGICEKANEKINRIAKFLLIARDFKTSAGTPKAIKDDFNKLEEEIIKQENELKEMSDRVKAKFIEKYPNYFIE